MAQFHITLDSNLLHELFPKDGRDDAFSKLLEAILSQILRAQSTEQLGVVAHERKKGWTYLASVMDLCSRKIIGYVRDIHDSDTGSGSR